MTEFWAVALITGLAVVSPGADFAMVTRNSLAGLRRAGVLTAAGIAAGVLVHVGYTLFGVAALMSHSPQLFVLVKYAGAAWLLWLGFSTWRDRRPPVNITADASTAPGGWRYFRQGFLTNALNPKTTLFVLSAFLQLVNPHTPLAVQLLYGAFMSLAHLCWFSLVALFFSSAWFRRQVLRWYGWINRIIGTLLMLLAGMLALT
ncbi:LysE family translocator [Affinibrenneria salicis]|uniref:LysE family translocator n=1 Tax=Affinibrenneria salicis TaxID=2590031 RepID=A0A5J5G1V7_9GAMM|nr:LysE family transporter [Affinibrenneria salicis]KAA9000605.1 LysE family translocator [Affinibrenneria salicis]